MATVQHRRRFSLSINIPSASRRRSVLFPSTPDHHTPATSSSPSHSGSRFSRVIRRLSTTLRVFPTSSPAPNINHVLPSYDSFLATDYVYDDDMDVSYEGLLRLAARIGDAKPKNLPHRLKATLPRALYKDCTPAQVEKRCPICLDQYGRSDSVLGITECSHYFHAACFEKWLDMASNCPVCRCEIAPSSSSSALPSPTYDPSSPMDDLDDLASTPPGSIMYRSRRDYDMPYNHVG